MKIYRMLLNGVNCFNYVSPHEDTLILKHIYIQKHVCKYAVETHTWTKEVQALQNFVLKSCL